MTHQQEVADRIAQLRREKSARERRDVLREEVAEAIGVSAVSYGRYENGQRKIPEEVIEALAKYHGTTEPFIRYGVRAARVQLTDEEVAAAIERSAAERARRGLPPIEAEDAIETVEEEAPARKAAGGRKRSRPRRGGK